MPVRHFCTYFDHRYLPRGLALIESTWKYSPDAKFYILALSPECAKILKKSKDPRISVTTLDELESADPALKEARSNRSLIEYYFTCTPCFSYYIVNKFEDIDILTYLDSDMLFYSDPEQVFSEIGDASVAITPHRFSPERKELVRFGKFNVGWVSWRRDKEGMRCLADYRQDCIAWCYDRLEEDRFGDQKYLDKWPNAYQGVHAIEHIGVNVAGWNINNYDITVSNGQILISNLPLVLFHFHGLKQLGDDRWNVALDQEMISRNPALISDLVKPYIKRLKELGEFLERTHGLDLQMGQHIRYDANPPAATHKEVPSTPRSNSSHGYEIIDRSQAISVTGEAWLYDDVAQIQAAAYRPLLDAMKAGFPRVDLKVAAEAVEATKLDHPTLLEVGCGSGYYSEVFATLLEKPPHYTGLDYSSAMIRLAERTYPQHTFQTADATALPFADNAFDIVMNGVSLMHIMDYEKAIQEACRVAHRFVIFHTATLLSRKPTSYLKKGAYGRPTAEVIINEGEFRALLARQGVSVVGVWKSIPYDLGPVLGESTYTRTFLCAVGPENTESHAILAVDGPSDMPPHWIKVGKTVEDPTSMAVTDDAYLPVPPESCDALYVCPQALDRRRHAIPAFLQACYESLRPGGRIRIAAHDLPVLCQDYLTIVQSSSFSDTSRVQNVEETLQDFIANGYAIAPSTLASLLIDTGFEPLSPTAAGQSTISAFQGLTFESSRLRCFYIEAIRTSDDAKKGPVV